MAKLTPEEVEALRTRKRGGEALRVVVACPSGAQVVFEGACVDRVLELFKESGKVELTDGGRGLDIAARTIEQVKLAETETETEIKAAKSDNPWR